MKEKEQNIEDLRKSLLNTDKCFYALFNQATDSIFLMDPTPEDGPIILEANNAACTIHGYTYEEIIGKPITSLDDPESKKEVPERTQKLMAGETLIFEANHVRKDGSTFPVEISAQVIHIGEKPFILAIDRDITKRKETERLLKAKLIELQEFYDFASARERKINELNLKIAELQSELANIKNRFAK